MVEIHSSCFLSSFLSSPAFPLPHRIAKNGRIGGGEMGFFLFPFFGERRVCVCVCVCVCVVDDVILGSKETGRTR